MKLEEFITNSNVRNAWVEYKNINIYVRRAAHMIDQKLHRTFDLANMNAAEETRGSGNLWRIVEMLSDASIIDPRILYVENVQNQRLAESLRTRGWIEIKTGSSFPSSFYSEGWISQEGRITVIPEKSYI